MRGTYHPKKSRGDCPYCLLPFFFLAGLLISCGIPSAPYLPPVPSSSVISPIGTETDYSFSIPPPAEINPEVFEGFEIYYKFFDPLTVAEKVGANGDTSLSSPVSLTSLQRAGYSRLASSQETDPVLPRYPLIPLLETDMNKANLRIELQFSNVSPAAPRSVYGNIFFRRTLRTSTGTRELKQFVPGAFSADDSDLPANFDLSQNFDIVIALYVLSYGNDLLNFSFNIHSTAVFLGNSRLEVDIPASGALATAAPE